MSIERPHPPLPEAIQTPERSSETASRYFDALLLGTPEHPGVLASVDDATTVSELEAIRQRIEDLAFDAEALVIFGQVEAAEAGGKGFQNTIARYEAKVISQPDLTKETNGRKAGRVISLLNKWMETHPAALREKLAPAKTLSTREYLAEKNKHLNPDGHWTEMLLPHRMVKTRLRAFAIENNLLEGLSEDDRALLDLEPNELSSVLTIIYEMEDNDLTPDQKFAPKINCDRETFSNIMQRFITLGVQAEALKQGKREGEDQAAWLNSFIEFQNLWLNLHLEMLEKVDARS